MTDYSNAVNEITELIKQATNPELQEPNWEINLAVCDMANANTLLCDDITRCLLTIFESNNTQQLLLALILTETLVKNGSNTLHTQVSSRQFLNEIAALTDKSKNQKVQEKALLLIRQWALAFSKEGNHMSTRGFRDIYQQLRMQGVEFPTIDVDAPIFTPPPLSPMQGKIESTSFKSNSMNNALSSTLNENRTYAQQIEKLYADLDVVMEKIQLLQQLRVNRIGNDEMEDVLDFLRQCQPRMNTLIEGGIVGKIDENTLEKCLTVNDNLIKALDETKNNAMQVDFMTFDNEPATSGYANSVSNSMNQMKISNENCSELI